MYCLDRTDHQWTGAPMEKRLTGGGGAALWGQSPTMSANYPMQVDQLFAVHLTDRMLVSVISNRFVLLIVTFK